MVLQKFRVSQSRFFSGYVRLVVCFFFYEGVSVSRFFCKAKGLEVQIRLFVFFKLRLLVTLLLNFIKAT